MRTSKFDEKGVIYMASIGKRICSQKIYLADTTLSKDQIEHHW